MANHDAQGRELFVCTQCKCRRVAGEFELDRHGHRRKGCLICKRRREAAKCPHGRRRAHCRECGGSSVCEHDRLRATCRECGGSRICEHDRQRAQCRECGGSSICEHNRWFIKCWECNPVGALWHRATTRITNALGTKDRAGRSTAAILGCDKDAFFAHIEAQFVDGMSWARIGEIDIDHRTPIGYPGAAGGPPTLEEKVARLHHLNCSPLWTGDNMAKGRRRADAPLPAPADAVRLTDADVDAILADVLG